MIFGMAVVEPGGYIWPLYCTVLIEVLISQSRSRHRYLGSPAPIHSYFRDGKSSQPTK